MQYLLDTDEPVPLSLPNQWLWDIIDEFIYQVRSFPPERKFLLLIKCEVHSVPQGGQIFFLLGFYGPNTKHKSFCILITFLLHNVIEGRGEVTCSSLLEVKRAVLTFVVDIYKNQLPLKHSVYSCPCEMAFGIPRIFLIFSLIFPHLRCEFSR